MSSGERLRAALNQRRAASALPPIDLGPRSAHEAVTRTMVEEIRRDVAELTTRTNGLIWAVVTAIVVTVATRLLGV